MTRRGLAILDRSHGIITGGSSGIGKATACLLAAHGADVTIIARVRATLDAAKAEIEGVRRRPEQRVLALSADVSDAGAIDAAIRCAWQEVGPARWLIASAGIAHPGYFGELDLEVFRRTMEVNYFGSLYAVRTAVELMKPSGRGQLVLISSGVGLLGIFGYTAYGPTKFAQRGLAECLRGELRPFGLGISVAYPPDTATPQLEKENATKPLETRRITGSAGVWSADDVAAVIVDGMVRGRFVIAPGVQMKLLARLHSLLGFVFHHAFDRIAERARRELARGVEG